MSIPRTPQDIVSIEMRRRVEDGEPSLTLDERRAILASPDAVEAEQRRRFIAGMDGLTEEEEAEARELLREEGAVVALGSSRSEPEPRPVSVSTAEAIQRRAKRDPVVQRFEAIRASRGGRLGTWEKHVLLTGQIPDDSLYAAEEDEEEPIAQEEAEAPREEPRRPRKMSKRARTFAMLGGGAALVALLVFASSTNRAT